MLIENSEGATAPSKPVLARRSIPWVRLTIGLALGLLGLWFVTRDVDISDLRRSLVNSHLQYVVLGLATIIVTMAMKAWRWQLMFSPVNGAPTFKHSFWALSLGQLVNTAVPFLRLGEVARVYDLGARAGQSKAQALGTLLVEKVLDLIMLVVTLAILIPFLVIPSFVGQSGTVLAVAGILALLALITVALQNELALRLTRFLAKPVPEPIRSRVLGIVEAGLQGLSALRSGKTLFMLMMASALIALLSVLTPWILFRAVDIELGIVAAAAIHVALTVGTLPPSTPARVGVFEFLVAFMLRFFDVEDGAVILAYTIIYHLVVVVPQLVLGGIAALRRDKTGHA